MTEHSVIIELPRKEMMVRKLTPDKRENFLNAALKLFVTHGVQNTSTAAIAKEAGTAAGTLFLYFPTKQDLINELVLQISHDQSDYMKTLLDPSLPVQERFFTIWQGCIRWFMEHREAYEYIQQVRDTGMVKEDIIQASAKSFAYFYDAIQKGMDEGALKLYPLEVIGAFLYQDIVAVMSLMRKEDSLEKQEEIIQAGFDIFWDGIRARTT
jgi:AcrR family transcriptional regulator